MKKIFLIAALFVFANSVSAQKKNELKVPEKAKAAFEKAYPNASDVKWGKEGAREFEVEFKTGGVSTSVVIDGAGNIKETETDITKSELPKGTEEFVAKNNKDWTITETAKIVDAKGKTTYEVQISKGKIHKDIIFDSEGKAVKK